MTAAPALVGIDLGTSAVKVLAVTPAGRELASGSEFYGLETPRPEIVEQDADAVYRATMRVLAGVLADARMRGSEVAAIGFSSAMHGVLAVDAEGEPIARVMTWMDRRAHAVADRWRDDGTAAALYRRTGAPMHPMLPVAKLAWLAENDPGLAARAARFVGLKELLVYRWTGEWLVDWGIASATGMFDVRERRWDAQALALASLDPAKLSTPSAPTTALRRFRPSIARELGIGDHSALVLASSDGALANLGVGSGEGDVAVTLGTSGAVRVLAGEPLLDRAARTFCYCADDTRYVVGGPTSSAGASLDWIFELLLAEVPLPRRFDRGAALASEIAPGAGGCTVLPFFAGERAPYWNSELRGAFEGIDLAHDRRTLIRAGFEGVVFGIRAVYEVVRELTGDAQRILLTGGLTKAAFVRGLVADVLGIPAARPRAQEAAALGAAFLAAQAVGLVDDARDAAHRLGYEPPHEPDAALRPAYEAAYARFQAAVAHVL